MLPALSPKEFLSTRSFASFSRFYWIARDRPDAVSAAAVPHHRPLQTPTSPWQTAQARHSAARGLARVRYQRGPPSQPGGRMRAPTTASTRGQFDSASTATAGGLHGSPHAAPGRRRAQRQRAGGQGQAMARGGAPTAAAAAAPDLETTRRPMRRASLRGQLSGCLPARLLAQILSLGSARLPARLRSWLGLALWSAWLC